MKYEVTKDNEGHVRLQLGLNHGVTFDPDATLDDIVEGVEFLIQTVVGVSAFELCTAVLNAWENDDEEATADTTTIATG
jgi:hypothetical protein